MKTKTVTKIFEKTNLQYDVEYSQYAGYKNGRKARRLKQHNTKQCQEYSANPKLQLIKSYGGYDTQTVKKACKIGVAQGAEVTAYRMGTCAAYIDVFCKFIVGPSVYTRCNSTQHKGNHKLAHEVIVFKHL